MHRLLFVGLYVLAAISAVGQETTPAPQELLERAFEADDKSQQLARQYAYRRVVEERSLAKNGDVKSVESKTYDVAHLCGQDYERLIERDGEPLSPSDDAKERRKLDKCIDKIAQESPEERRKRLDKEEEKREEQRKLRREIVNAFDFTIEGEELVDDEPTWRIHAEPKPDYEPKFGRAKFLNKLVGKIWISQNDYGWVKTEFDTIAPAKFGLFLLTLKKGAHMEFTQTKVNDEIWMMDHFRVRFAARVVVKGLRREIAIDYSDFKKFAAESRIVTTTID